MQSYVNDGKQIKRKSISRWMPGGRAEENMEAFYAKIRRVNQHVDRVTASRLLTWLAQHFESLQNVCGDCWPFASRNQMAKSLNRLFFSLWKWKLFLFTANFRDSSSSLRQLESVNCTTVSWFALNSLAIDEFLSKNFETFPLNARNQIATKTRLDGENFFFLLI